MCSFWPCWSILQSKQRDVVLLRLTFIKFLIPNGVLSNQKFVLWRSFLNHSTLVFFTLDKVFISHQNGGQHLAERIPAVLVEMWLPGACQDWATVAPSVTVSPVVEDSGPELLSPGQRGHSQRRDPVSAPGQKSDWQGHDQGSLQLHLAQRFLIFSLEGLADPTGLTIKYCCQPIGFKDFAYDTK